MSRISYPTLREVSNINPLDIPKPINSGRHNSLPAPILEPTRSLSTTRSSAAMSPQVDRRNRRDAIHCTDVVGEISEMFFARERTVTRSPNYLSAQTEVNEKMRMILVDWLVDVHLKFKLHEESLFLAIDILDRYLAASRTTRQTLQLVGVTAMLIAAKYEEIYPPEVRDCIHISANTYTREEILKMERGICSALQFKFTTPTPFPFLVRLLTVSNADETLRNLAFFYLEHGVLDYRNLQYLPSQVAAAAMFLANVAMRREPWGATLQHYAKCSAASFINVAEGLLQFVNFAATTKYQAVRRKYAMQNFGEVTSRTVGVEMPQIESERMSL